jgi:hypothetical protein
MVHALEEIGVVLLSSHPEEASRRHVAVGIKAPPLIRTLTAILLPVEVASHLIGVVVMASGVTASTFLVLLILV